MRKAILPVPMLALALVLAACDQAGAPGSPEGAASTASPTFPDAPDRVASGPYAPRNECIDVPGAKGFLIEFERAVKDRDADALLSITDADVRLDFGGGGGLATFRERLADPEGRLWTALDRITMLGCASESPDMLVLPWYFAQDMQVEDPFKTMLVIGEEVPLRASPSAEGEVRQSVSWDTVELAGSLEPGAEFQRVTTAEGTEGYIASEQLRSLVDYRLSAQRQGDTWRIVSFVAGD